MIKYSDNLIDSSVALVTGEKNITANLANIASLIFNSIDDLNWAGFYLWDDANKNLVLGPFQGKPACIRIPLNKGVCGKAYAQTKTLIVGDVLSFDGHIACDSDSKSELVVPLILNDNCVGVFDLDSPKLNRFTQADALMIENLFKKVVPIIWA